MKSTPLVKVESLFVARPNVGTGPTAVLGTAAPNFRVAAKAAMRRFLLRPEPKGLLGTAGEYVVANDAALTGYASGMKPLEIVVKFCDELKGDRNIGGLN